MPLLLYLLIISLHAASPVFLSPSLSALNGSTCHAQSQKCTTSYVLDRFDTNRLRCFGRDLNGLSGEEDIKWAKIALGYRHMCGILAEDSDSDRGVATTFTCRFVGRGECPWFKAQVPSDYKDVKFKNICSGAYFSCGIGKWREGENEAAAREGWDLCAIEEGIDRLHCWGDEDIMRKSVHLRERRLRNVSVGYDHACAIEVDSSMNVCWGSNSKILEDEDGHVQTFVTEKSRSFHRKIEQVSAGWDHSCAVDAYRRLTCWGDVGVGGKGMQRGGGGGGEPGGEFLAVKASTHYSCAVHVSGTLMCWGESLPGMEQTNWERLQMCDEGNTLQVAHFGPMLSSITHIDGSWLLFVDKDVNLFEDEFVMIENPLANSFHLQTQGKLQVDVVVARIPKGVESLDVMLFVDEKQVTSKTIRRQELGAETPTLCDYNNHDCIERREEHLSFEVNNLSEGFHLVEAAALIDGSAAISHKIPFTLLLPARSTQDNPPSYLIPQVAVVGTNGSVILNNINAKELVFFSSYSKHHLTDVSWPSKLWPIATISTLEQRNTFRLNRVLDAEVRDT
ncbi:hypothetical protein GUITHDRAFT_142191 [Guillardia theta CCMP2712]|uniref:non-specific serine/threonine protein kinase n=1 Tax=Guillardia theta (strain CCMP2712) TaxID=905079 RepID=L1IYF9_GUITC|nr:hypothetical protein GUITHDRAFT_142191 [Guillardia theta CCMP2712]EKX41288.1 hypothetical protein GUITHDRAFT_142191 [Guillardia theta CCMP2712]|eukprot:XP_005828268.1 hypothetical protein GUITHDRAFT_142191 [Guillardia theta CCMP2712]